MRSLIAFASVAMALTACSNNEEAFVNSNFPEDGVIRVATNVDAPITRAGVDDNNISSFYMDVKNRYDDNYCYFVQMKKESGAWSSYIGNEAKQMLWQNDSTSIKVTAAYLNGHAFTQTELQGTASLSLGANQSTDAAIEANDLVAMAQTTIDPAGQNESNLVEGKVKVTLSHALSKLNLEVTLGTEFNEETGGTADNPITSLAINGTRLNYTYAGVAAIVTLLEADNDATEVIPAAGTYIEGSAATNAVANYECILVPQTVAANKFSVTMVINEKTYTWTSKTDVTMAQGTAYTLKLTARKETLVARTLSASAWGDENKGVDLGTDFANN